MKTQVKKSLKTQTAPLTKVKGRARNQKRCIAFADLPVNDLRFVLLALPG